MNTAEKLWKVSRILHRNGHPRLAKIVKTINFLIFHGQLPSQAIVGNDVRVGHHGMGIVIHPNVRIGDDVFIWHNVTIAAETAPGSDKYVIVDDHVTIGAGAIIIARHDAGLRIGKGATVGAGAIVTRDVPPYSTVVGDHARLL